MSHLQYLVDFCERGRAVGPDGISYKCETGEPFVTFASCRKAEGEMGTASSSSQDAIAIFKASFAEYASGKDGWAIYWRHRPTLEERDGAWQIFARLVLVEIKEQSNG